jgi:hypothetical protein
MPAPASVRGSDQTSTNHARAIKHTIGPVSLKMYDKHGFILRIETTVNDVSFFKHYRQVEHNDGTTRTQWASMKKGCAMESWCWLADESFGPGNP